MAKRPKIDWKSLPKGDITSWKDVENFVKKPAAKKSPVKKAPKASKNPIGDFIKDEVKKRQLPVVQDKQARTGNANKAKSPKVIRAGHTPGSASRAVVPYKAPAPRASVLGSVARTVGRVAGPVGALVGMTTSTGDGKEDKPSGKLFSPSANRAAGSGNPKTTNKHSSPGSGNPKTTNPHRKANPNLGIGEGVRSSPAKAASPAPKPKAKPAREAPKAAAAPMKKASASAPAYSPPKAEKRVGGKVTSGFSGNWVGAAPTAMQARGGAKISRGGGLLGKLKKR